MASSSVRAAVSTAKRLLERAKIGTVGMNDTFAVDHQDIVALCAGLDDQVSASNGGCTGTQKNNDFS